MTEFIIEPDFDLTMDNIECLFGTYLLKMSDLTNIIID